MRKRFGRIRAYHVCENYVVIEFEYGEGSIEIVTPTILRVYAQCEGKKMEDSFSIRGHKYIPCFFEIIGNTDKYDYISIHTQDVMIHVHHDFLIDVYNSNKELLCADAREHREIKNTFDREKFAELVQNEGHEIEDKDENHNIEVVKKMFGDEKFYGLGDKPGFLNKKGYAFENWNSDLPQAHNEAFRALYKSVPFFVTLRQCGVFGIFFDNPNKSWFDMGKENQKYYYFAADRGNLNYYFIMGKNMPEVIKNYTYLTGTTPLPQLWTLGYHQSRWSYESRQEVFDLVKNFKKYEIPCDAIHLDIDYMQDYKVFTWNEKKFPKHKDMIMQLYNGGMKVVVIMDPGVKLEQEYFMYEEGIQNGYFAKDEKGRNYENQVWPGTSLYPDFLQTNVRNWWAKKHQALASDGVAGIWNDMNEPASFHGPLPMNVIFKQDGQQVTQEQIHNVYGSLMSEASFDGMKEYSRKRPFILTRACYAGIQKYAAVWTGDNQSLWSHLQMAIPQLCNLGLSGIAFAGTDVGGFGADTTEELLIRWVQLGCFSPFFRNHCAKPQRRQEPWVFGEPCLSIYRKYTRLRYQLLPYLYDMFVKCEKTGEPIMRPLVFTYEEDQNTWECNDEFMFGDNMLIAPVVEQGKKVRMIYLPKGIWYDFWTNERVEGSRYLLKSAPLDICPIYIKEDSIIPMYDVANYIGEQEYNILYMHVYGKEAQYAHYQDNGEDYAYRDGQFNEYFLTFGRNGAHVQMLHQGYDRIYDRIIVKQYGSVIDIVKGTE